MSQGRGIATRAKKRCFVIAPIGADDSPERRRSDQVLKYIIQPVCDELGYQPIRADKIEAGGQITTQIINHVIEDELVIADLTGHNPNVFYELALRHAFNKPFVHLMEQGERLPFDVANQRTIFVNTSDLDSVDSAKEQLLKQIRSLEGGAAVDSPVSQTVTLSQLTRSGDPQQQTLAEILEAINNLRAEVSRQTLSAALTADLIRYRPELFDLTEIIPTARADRGIKVTPVRFRAVSKDHVDIPSSPAIPEPPHEG